MLNRKSMLAVVTSLLLIVAVTTSQVQANTSKISEDVFIDNHIEALINGDISPVNRSPELNARVRTGISEANKNCTNVKKVTSQDSDMSQPSLYSEAVSLDTVPLDNSKNRYLVTAIVKQTYKIPKEESYNATRASDEISKTYTFCDVKMAFSAVYNHYSHKGMEYYRVSQYKGGYMSKSDPQMTCKNIRFRHRAFGRFYTASYDFIRSLGYTAEPKSISNPEKGKKYTYTINQNGYVEAPPGFSAGRLDYTVARTTSSYTSSNYMAIDFGEPINPFQ